MIMQAFFKIAACAALVVFPTGAASESDTQALHDGMDAAFGTWRETHTVSGALATGVLDAAGKWDVARLGDHGVAELASVSKSVTAVCVLELVEARRLAWSDSVDSILGDAPDVTVAELVTHTSGLSPDATQLAMALWLDQTSADGRHFSQEVLGLVNARTPRTGTQGSYLYNNENYALLGLVIEAVTQQPFFDFCRSKLELGPTFKPSVRTAGFQPWGGLVASPADYLGFLVDHFGPGSVIANDPLALPHVDVGDGAYYGMGMFFRRFGTSFNFWHFGLLCFPGRLNIGSYAVIWEGRASAVATYDGCLDWDTKIALDNDLSAAVYQREP
ncbi:serine hydrolase [uncultured Tateyamaria sp.]|uniref:serine hydrolase domain-containing protein n=1 Tax=uncultured Tateyamaria sp. TaxID=455651 RepID=UPI00260B41FC|nr:serine hydrolase domain-containing protein [uncultured Tateyamaria sp.]